MRYKKVYFGVFSTIPLLLFISCVEEIGFETESFESALVIEATITNEIKQQEVILSRTYLFEEGGPKPETNAEVRVFSENGEVLFQEIEDGKYVSENEFNAKNNSEYTLKIITSNGSIYSSDPVKLTQATQIDQLYAIREGDDLGNNRMAIYVDSYDATNNSKFYRYTYEESYKIIAPKWVPEDMIVIDPTWPECSVALVPKKTEKRVCYNIEKSNSIIQTNTSDLAEDRIHRFLVREISGDNYIISWRYSIIVTQYVQSQQSYTYYETLDSFTEDGSLFSQIQTGYFNGNIISDNNPEEKVLGFFDVSSVSSKRIFFNYEDFYLGEDRPNYARPCYEYAPVQNQGHPTDQCGSLINGIQYNQIVYFRPNPNPTAEFDGPFIMVPRACGDCTVLGKNIVPDFWEE